MNRGQTHRISRSGGPGGRHWQTALLASVAFAGLAGPAGAQQAEPGTANTTTQTAAARASQAGTAEPVAADAPATQLDRLTAVSRTGESAIDTLGSVSHIGEEQLRERMATTPLEMMDGVPGVTVQADSKRLASSVNIRGLQDFGRVAVIVDGARQNFQRSGHGTQSVFWIDPLLVKQVDVVRGPVANTYGSGAIGGVVVFETKDAADFLMPDETYAWSLTGQYETNGGGWTTSATGAYRFNDNFDVLGNIVWRDYGDYSDGDGATVAGTGFDVLSGMVKATVRPDDYSDLRLGWVGAKDGWKEGGGTADVDLRQNTLTGRYHLTSPDADWLDMHVDLSYSKTILDQTYLTDVTQFDPTTGNTITIPAGSQTSYDLDTYGIDLWNTSRFDTGPLAHEITYGGDWLQDDVETTSPIGGSDFFTPSGTRRLWGAYVQDKITYDWLEVIGALRYDNYSLDGTNAKSSGSRLSPRLTVGVSPFEGTALGGLQIYGTYAEGYRAPSTSETLISGLHPNGVVFPFLPNPALRPEVGKTWEAGVNYRRDGIFSAADSLRLKAAYFRNDIDDFIDGQTLSAFDPTSGCPLRPDLLGSPSYIPICYQYQNFAEGRIHGIELEAFYDAGRVFAGLTASVIDGYRVSAGVREDLVTIPAAQVTGKLGFRMLDQRLVFGGEVQYNSPPEGAVFNEDYTLVNAFAHYKVSDNFRVDFRADNIFDVQYANPLNASTTSTIYEPGINLKIAATMRFGG